MAWYDDVDSIGVESDGILSSILTARSLWALLVPWCWPKV